MLTSSTTSNGREQPAHGAASLTFSHAASASDIVFFGIVNGLEMQTFVPSQRLVEADLAAQFGVGRNSVREALQRLAAEGFVELSRHKGAAVRLLSAQDTLDVLDVAERMTGLLARSATLNGASSEAMRLLKDSMKEIVAADSVQDALAFAKARRRFYRALLDMSASKELKRLFPAIQMPIVLAQFRLPTLQKLRVQDYLKIAAAVMSGRADEAEAAGMAHVRHVRDEIVRALGSAPVSLD
ncbi:MAG: GntR family transcriptional regulator [Comamonadaceae bacterium]|nr:MAG: GntR family transcriptional regulator [Comamonadaceae bacterium]